MKKYIRLLALGLLAAVLLALGAWADEGAVLAVSSAQAEAGDTVTLQLTLENNPGVAAVSVYLDYDTAKLRPISYEISREANQRFMISLANESSGSVMMVALKDVDYSGVIAELEFEVLSDAVGEAEVSVSGVELCTFDDEIVAYRSESGSVTIEDTSAAPESGEKPTGESTAKAEGQAERETAVSPSPQAERDVAAVEDDSEWIQDSVARFEEEWGGSETTTETAGESEAETTEESEETVAESEPESEPVPQDAPAGGYRLLILAAVLLVLAAAVFVGLMLLRKKERAARH